jgi:hypothetical protein
MLTRSGATVSRVAGAVAARLSEIWGRLVRARLADLLRPGSGTMNAAAAVLVVSGQVVAVALAPPGTLRLQAAVASLLVLVSLAVTLTVFVASSPRRGPSRAAAVGAWFVGVLPWAAAVIPALWPFAWIVSAIVTLTMLRRAGLPQAWSVRVTALAWGMQALAGIGAWVAGNLATLLLMR